MPRKYELHTDLWEPKYKKSELIDLGFQLNKVGMYYLANTFFLFPFERKTFRSSRDCLEHIKKEIKTIIKIQKQNRGKICGAHSEIKRLARFMYEMDLEEMPLHISDASAVPKIVSHWRLKIGK